MKYNRKYLIFFTVRNCCLDILQHSNHRRKEAHFVLSSEAGLLRRNVAPFLDDGLLDLPGVSSGPGADLLGNIHTLLSGG